MKKISLLLLLLCGLLIPSMQAQDPMKTQENLGRLAMINPNTPGFPTFSNVDRTKGTPFLLDGWQRGQVKFGQNQQFSSELDIAFNMEQDQLIIRLSDGQAGYFPLVYLHSLKIFSEGDTLYFEAHNLKKTYGDGPAGHKLYSVLHRGENTLYQYTRKFLRREKYVENLGMVRRPDIYQELNSYWYVNGQQVVEVKKNVKALRKAIPQKANTIKKLVKKENINLKESAELGRLFALLEEK